MTEVNGSESVICQDAAVAISGVKSQWPTDESNRVEKGKRKKREQKQSEKAKGKTCEIKGDNESKARRGGEAGDW